MTSHLDDNIIPQSRQREIPRAGLNWIGKGMKRLEDPRILTGKGKYIDDISLQNMAHAAMVHSPYAHARILSIDTSKALALPGVIGIFTGEDIAKYVDACPSFASPAVPQLCVAVGKVRHIGEVVCAIVADDRYIAEDAAELVEVEYEILPVNVDMEEALKATGDALIHPEAFDSNCPVDQKFSFGPVEEDFARATHIIKRRLRWPRSSAQAIETCGCISEFDENAGSYSVYSNTNFYSFIPWVLAGSLKVSPTQLKMMPVAIGGSFGSKVFTHKIIILTCALARATGQPVKYIEDRLAHFLNSDSHGSDRLYDAELALDDYGKMLSLRFTVLDDYGAYLQFGVGTHGNAMAQVTGAYTIGSFGMHVKAVLTNKCQQGPYRGFGSEVTNWVIERLTDAAAQELGYDPVDLRLRNMIQPDQFPYMLPTGNIYDSGNFQAVLAEAKKLIDWDEWATKLPELRARGKYVGIGVATCMERSVYSPTEWWSLNKLETPGFTLSSTPEGILVRIDGSGKFFIQLNSPFIGNSPETVVAQVMCEQFDIQPGDVMISYADSQSGFNGVGPQGSRFTAMVTGACVSASIKLKEKLFRYAAHHLQRTQDDLELRGGMIVSKENPTASVSIGEIALMASFFRLNFPDDPAYDSGLEVTAVYDHPVSTLPHPERKHLGIFYPIVGHVCHIAVVEVDVETGKVTILDYSAVHDNGTIVNPLTLAGQVLGGTMNGIGSTLYEEFIHDESGQFVNPNFAEYGMPTAHEMPGNIKIGHIETPSPFTEYGVKGGGEGGRLAAPSALTSAIEDALKPFGVYIDQLPLPPAKIYKLIHGE
jgi:CO/xanthine dehydrogenase Mo-binding subunit